MANKFLDDIGLKHLWDKATSIFAKKTDVEASIAECHKQLNGLTFKTSSSVPTVDDRSVITFVVEG